MDFRNAIYVGEGRIDAEIAHPVHGWIPCTLSPDDPHTAELYAAAAPGAAPYVPDLDAIKAEKLKEMEAARFAAEEDGVTVNGVRYSGDAGNRQALREALEYADAAPLSNFPAWKSSDRVFLNNHPVQEVRNAYSAIGARRVELIAQEGERVDAIKAATDVAAVEAITWSGV